jgi:DNA-binding transcriptional ArsR family regulator
MSQPDRVFKALSDPVRIKILQFLRKPEGVCCAQDGVVCACDVESLLGVSQATVSHHMRLLVDAGLVRAQKQGLAKRLAYVLGAPFVPFVLLARIGATVIGKRCRVGKFIVALPLIVIALVVLVAGEWVGCVLGPGDALAKVE